MIHEAIKLSPEKKAAAELLLGRPVHDGESISVQAFEPPPVSEQQRRQVAAELQELFDQVDVYLRSANTDDSESVFVDAMRNSRPGYRNHK